MGLENAKWFESLVDESVQGMHSDRYMSLPHQPSLLYQYLTSEGNSAEVFNSFRKAVSHHGFLMVTQGSLDMGDIRGIEIATFMHSEYRGVLDYWGNGFFLQDRGLLGIPDSEDSEEYWEYVDSCKAVSSWFFHANRDNIREIYLESEKLSSNLVLKYVLCGLRSKSNLNRREIEILFNGLFSQGLHFYHIDIGKNILKEYL